MLNLENENCIELIKLLISKGANVNIGDFKTKNTPLHIIAG